ncbi:uncharacterized protein PHALS_15488 [Plasmopara halstedii]|uniref:Uncharacterized protein n=1 Tax=Plasmopara halstedii TaxID=4781 RepID=A0A0P1AKI8_PLAHL|nr:uncharacterized protein PHALS_15488 [Plasmopara halstedii]CEG41085.1 hypothetical protein PHALS_15488 [Plasmopara halstedii]|eukprot:XP_024577454.1 hypothetical protein PHALS_15488 [Plasmopara halstedii]
MQNAHNLTDNAHKKVELELSCDGQETTLHFSRLVFTSQSMLSGWMKKKGHKRKSTMGRQMTRPLVT